MVSASYVGTLLIFQDTTSGLESSETWIFLTASTDMGVSAYGLMQAQDDQDKRT